MPTGEGETYSSEEAEYATRGIPLFSCEHLRHAGETGEHLSAVFKSGIWHHKYVGGEAREFQSRRLDIGSGEVLSLGGC